MTTKESVCSLRCPTKQNKGLPVPEQHLRQGKALLQADRSSRAKGKSHYNHMLILQLPVHSRTLSSKGPGSCAGRSDTALCTRCSAADSRVFLFNHVLMSILKPNTCKSTKQNIEKWNNSEKIGME